MTPAEDAEEITAAATKATVWAKWIAIIGGAVVALITPAITAHQLAVSEGKSAAAKVAATTVDVAAKAKSDGQTTKNEAEAGYQLTKKWADNIEARIALVERLQHPAAPGKRRKRIVVPAPVKLPADLKQAEKVVLAGTPVHAPPAPVPAAPLPAPPVIIPYRDASPR